MVANKIKVDAQDVMQKTAQAVKVVRPRAKRKKAR